MSGPAYDDLGRGYAAVRRPDPRIAAGIERALGDAVTVLNVGAGTGSYEPADRSVTAVEPSSEMIAQRGPRSAPVHQASAEALPFASDSFDAAMAVLTLHHWADLEAGLAELCRVARRRVVAVTFDPAALLQLWIVRDYFPGMVRASNDPSASASLLKALPAAREVAVPVPCDCTDHFFAALWGRPELFFEPEVLGPMWVWQRLEKAAREEGSERLAADLRSGAWEARYGHLRELKELDVGLRIVISEPTKGRRQAG